ncbi:related to 5-carboxyvanillate decarboxylase [Cephalotrichum gorgonifer]|uniref:Related to 5-carboxyvanillate decarboxylase n=1 Tax=Cephalotrichum gorgonifer TaxID=2041049 RepID=A0AAE8MVF5_9PEZI|nr:related to 5-carboxyvanillate decarboxylase [Cephalotrichum gorgonifer]
MLSGAVLLCALMLMTKIQAKKWNNTGSGSIVFEESFTLPYPQIEKTAAAPLIGETVDDLMGNLADIHNQRIRYMDESGVDYMILSLAAPGIQSVSDSKLAEDLATKANDDVAKSISNNTLRFGAFAALSMHDPEQASRELLRCVKELGFHGALLNDYQQSGLDNNTLLYYDTPDYDVFWETAVELDVPVYLHPRSPVTLIKSLEYAHAPELIGGPHQFAISLSTHIAGLCTNGVFDRFPSLKIIVGHLGERLPADLWRLDEMLERKKPSGLPMEKSFSSYWQTNIYETTAGQFWTPLLDFHWKVIGEDRILYSVDYPFNRMQEGASWIESLPYCEKSKKDLIRNNAIKLFKLDGNKEH